jgi:hypothetical protein
VSESRDIQNHMMVIACQAAQGEHASGKAMLRAVTKALAGDKNLMRKIIAKHAPAAAQAQPLTDEQIDSIAAGPCWHEDGIDPIPFARAIERAHGIGAAGATGEQP